MSTPRPAALAGWRTVMLRLVALVALASPALAHRPATGNASPDGAIVIPNLSHGQMRVIAEHRDAIMDLAGRQFPTDPTMRRLEGFINLQRFACLWGIMPGSLTDETSPFNECAHAYLAATRALLIHLQGMPGDRKAVNALVTTIEIEMLDNHASLILCRYSDEPFDTADVISPRWASVPAHPPTSLALGGITMAMAGFVWLARRSGRTSGPLAEPA